MMLPMDSHENNRKKDGFNGQKAIVLPRKIIESCEASALIRNLFITDIGFYPKAKYHYRKRPHGSSQHILIYCTDGAGWFEIDGHTINVKQGKFLYIPAGTPHVYGSHENDPWSIYWLHFTGKQASHMESLLTIMEHSCDCRPVSYSEERVRLFDRIYNTLETGYSADNLAYVNMCLWHFLSSFCYPDIFLLPQQQEYKDIMDVAVDYMLQNLHRPLQLQELADNAHISVSYFSALFKKKTGYPPLEYFNHIKIQKACQYLQFTKMHVKEIAYKLGIDDPFYFSRLFTNMMGISPAEYRHKKEHHRILPAPVLPSGRLV
jgi:AraC-like DNA-binding protein/mannose-6-phosphate isomerase-like protein (cupin superfamily)